MEDQQSPYKRNNVWKGSNLELLVKCNEHSRLGEIQSQKLQANSITWLELYHIAKRRLLLEGLKNVSVCNCVKLPYTCNPNERHHKTFAFTVSSEVQALWLAQATRWFLVLSTALESLRLLASKNSLCYKELGRSHTFLVVVILERVSWK